MTTRMLAAAATLAATLAACGGDSSTPAPGSTPPQPTVPAPSGLYTGTTSTNYELNMLVLEDFSVWGIYGRTANGVQYVYSVVQANGAASNGSFSATDGRDYYYTGLITPGTVSASYSASGTFNGSVTSTAGALTFVTSRQTGSTYNYDAAAQTSAVVGTWTGSALDGSTTTVVISGSGSFSGSSRGCAFTGSIAPRPSGKNVFNVSMTFANSTACAAPAATATGIAIAYPITGSSRSQLIVGVQNAARTLGTGFFASR